MNPQQNPTENLLLKRIADGSLNDQKLEQALLQRCDMNYPETPLQEVVEDCSERFGLRLAMRWRRKTVVLMPPEPPHEPPLPAMHEIPFSDEWILREPDDLRASPQFVDMRPRSLARPAASALLPPVVKNIFVAPVSMDVRNGPRYAGFDAMLSPLGLVLDYRYGVLCVVDAEGAELWKDATGVMELRPAGGTPLAERLDFPAKPILHSTLRGALRNLAVVQQIPVSLRYKEEDLGAAREFLDQWLGLPTAVMTFPAAPSPKEPLPITLRQLLGLILDQANLHCHEENGVLIIEPPLKAAAQAETRQKP